MRERGWGIGKKWIRVLQDRSRKSSRCKLRDQKVGGVTRAARKREFNDWEEEILVGESVPIAAQDHTREWKTCLPASPSSDLPLHPTTTSTTSITNSNPAC